MTKYKVEFEIEVEGVDDVIRGLGEQFSGITKLNVEEAKPDVKYRTFGDVQVHTKDQVIADAVARGGYVQGGQVTSLPMVDTSYYGPYGSGAQFGVD